MAEAPNNAQGPAGKDESADAACDKDPGAREERIRDIDMQVDAVVDRLKEGRAVNLETNEKVRIDGDVEMIKREEVFLRVYDLSQGTAKVLSERLLGFRVEGVWHTSIEIYGNEYYFQNGLVYQVAGTTYYGQVVERISLGFTDCTRGALEEFFEMSRHTWTPDSYDLFENNCNNFSDYLSNFLVEKGIPQHILELPEMVKASPMFQKFFGSRK